MYAYDMRFDFTKAIALKFMRACCSVFLLSELVLGATAFAQTNVAAQANGATATASTAYYAITVDGTAYTFAPSAAIDGDRKGLNWGFGGGWNDATSGVFPDWLQVNFSGVQTIAEVDVFTVQDNYTAPADPTASMTFARYGITQFQVQYWNGSAWLDVPGGSVTANELVWRRFAFAPITTDRIRIVVNAALESYSRIVEVEAWTPPTAPTIALSAPADNAMLSAPAAVMLSATAAALDGSVSKVEFLRNGAVVATVSSASSGTYTFTDSNVGVGSYSYTAKVYDNATPPRITESTIRVVSVSATPSGAVNVASGANGATASASSAFAGTFGGTAYTFPASAAINGDRKGLSWGYGGGWNDMTIYDFPDWLQVNFDGVQTIGEIDVFTVQDNYAAPVEPTASMTFTRYGITDFQVQYWNGTAWVDVPGGNVIGNKLVWRRFPFAAISTDRIRILVNRGLESYSRIIEVEAWTAATMTPRNVAPTIDLTSPADNTMLASPATVNLSAAAADADGTVSKVEFYRDGALIATVTGSAGGFYRYTDGNIGPGSYSYTAKVYDDASPPAITSSAARLINVSATPAGAKNVAVQANGGTATASSTFNSVTSEKTYTFAASGAIDGDRKGLRWEFDGGWNDATAGTFPDWLQVNFNGVQTIGEIDVFTVQDTYTAPVEPTATMVFTQYGITDFQVQYWNGSAWMDVPGGNVTGNNLVWRRFTFAAIATDRIRVLVNGALQTYSRIVEVEAWTATGAATAEPAKQLYFIHTDHLNSPRVITNGAGQAVWRWDNLDPFGANTPDENPSGLGSFTCNLRFPGQYFDRETNLHYNYFRDYDPTVGRYVESDPIGLLGGVNTYTYVLGPLDAVDVLGFAPSGRLGPNAAAGSPLSFLALTVALPIAPFGDYRGYVRTACGSDNGFAVPNTFDGISIENACAQHDDCYGKACGVSQETCDRQFLDRMKQACGNQPRCLIGAYAYYGFVRWKGGESFSKAREWCRNGQCGAVRTW